MQQDLAMTSTDHVLIVGKSPRAIAIPALPKTDARLKSGKGPWSLEEMPAQVAAAGSWVDPLEKLIPKEKF